MKKSLKGSVLGTVLIIAAIVAVVVVVLLLLGFGGFGIGGGKGDGEGASTEEAVAVMETVKETAATEKLEYIDVTVSGNEYLYQNGKITLDELMEKISTDNPGVPVKITDDNASLNAYQKLLNALEENGIKYIK